jgi:hypothetical protein
MSFEEAFPVTLSGYSLSAHARILISLISFLDLCALFASAFRFSLLKESREARPSGKKIVVYSVPATTGAFDSVMVVVFDAVVWTAGFFFATGVEHPTAINKLTPAKASDMNMRDFMIPPDLPEKKKQIEGQYLTDDIYVNSCDV